MPSKLCHICGTVVPSTQWQAHLRRHRDAKSERKGGGRPWRKIRAAVLERDGYKCTWDVGGRICGSTVDLEVHHKNGNWKDDRMVNLQTVCFSHNPRGRTPQTRA